MFARRLLVLVLIALHCLQGFAAASMTVTWSTQALVHQTPCHEVDAIDTSMMDSVASEPNVQSAPSDPSSPSDCCKTLGSCAMCVSVGMQTPIGKAPGLSVLATAEHLVPSGTSHFTSASVAALIKPPIL